jgi:hypothetical protein
MSVHLKQGVKAEHVSQVLLQDRRRRSCGRNVANTSRTEGTCLPGCCWWMVQLTHCYASNPRLKACWAAESGQTLETLIRP